jgi:HlyD family secretion protein
MKKVIRGVLILAVVAAAALGAYAWLSGRDAGPGIKTVEVVTGSITEKAVAVGKIEPRLKFQVKSKISGIVRKAAVDVGDTVQAGQILFEIVPDPTPQEVVEARRTLELAQAAFERAEADFRRANELGASGIVPRGDLDARRESFERTRISVAPAQDNLDLVKKGRITSGSNQMESVVRAPAGGTVLSRAVNPGDPVVPLTSYQAGTELATIAPMGDLIFKGTVDEIDVGKLQVGLPARLKIGALPDAAVTGIVTRIAPQAIERDNSKLFEVEIELDPGQHAVLRAGYSANADVVIREKKDIVLVAERLVTFEDAGKKAFVELPGAGPKDEPRKVEIKTGLSDGLNVEVVEGLKAGDRVIERPPREIKG